MPRTASTPKSNHQDENRTTIVNLEHLLRRSPRINRELFDANGIRKASSYCTSSPVPDQAHSPPSDIVDSRRRKCMVNKATQTKISKTIKDKLISRLRVARKPHSRWFLAAKRRSRHRWRLLQRVKKFQEKRPLNGELNTTGTTQICMDEETMMNGFHTIQWTSAEWASHFSEVREKEAEQKSEEIQGILKRARRMCVEMDNRRLSKKENRIIDDIDITEDGPPFYACRIVTGPEPAMDDEDLDPFKVLTEEEIEAGVCAHKYCWCFEPTPMSNEEIAMLYSDSL